MLTVIDLKKYFFQCVKKTKKKREPKSLGMEIYERHNRKGKREECKILILLNITCFKFKETQ